MAAKMDKKTLQILICRVFLLLYWVIVNRPSNLGSTLSNLVT